MQQFPIVVQRIHFAALESFTVFPNYFELQCLFSVRRVDGADAAGQVMTVTYSLSPDSMTTACGYDAMREDPDIYKTLDFCGYLASRYFPDMQLPVPGAPSASDISTAVHTTMPVCSRAPDFSHSRHARQACTFSEASGEGSLLLFQRKG